MNCRVSNEPSGNTGKEQASPAKGSTRQDQDQQSVLVEEIDTSTHATGSLAAMSTDDISSIGETNMTYYTGTTSGSRRKRKDDCSESRCTVTSEESARSRRRRRRSQMIQQQPDQQHRWLDRIDRKAATSHAPIRPNRRDDDGFLLPAEATTPAVSPNLTPRFSSTDYLTFQRSISHTLPRPGGGVHILLSSPLSSAQAQAVSSSCCSDAATRKVARCQSMSLPPVRPIRNESKTDLMKDSSHHSKTDLMKDIYCSASGSKRDKDNHNDETVEKDEIDPDMFVRLLRGQAVDATLSPPSLDAARSGGSQTGPPKRPRRRLTEERQHSRLPVLTRYHTVAAPSTRDNATPSRRACRRTKCQSFRDTCSHAISPKPPAKPLRTFDDSTGGDDDDIMPQTTPAAALLQPPLLPKVSRISIEEAATLDAKLVLGSSKSDQKEQLETSTSNRMDLEEAEEEDKVEVGVVEVDGKEYEEEPGFPSGEYDPDLFARLLNGESCSEDATPRNGTSRSATKTQGTRSEDAQLPTIPVLATTRVSSSSAKQQMKPSAPLGYNRFDNSSACALPEHMEGAMKSSHPPMRPRRSFDEGMLCRISKPAVSLANVAAAACMAGISSASPVRVVAEPSRGRICIVGGKRRYSQRRATLALASELPPSGENSDATAAAVSSKPNDPTQEVNLMAIMPPLGESFGAIDEHQEEYEQRDVAVEVACSQNDGSFQRILPARRHRRVVRRFTMPSKGACGEMMSPQAKKRRTIGRSLSCRPPEDGKTPAAA